MASTSRSRVSHLSWSTRFVVGGVALLVVSFALFAATPVPLLVSTLGAVVGGAAFVLGVSGSVSAFLQRDAYADSDFYR